MVNAAAGRACSSAFSLQRDWLRRDQITATHSYAWQVMRGGRPNPQCLRALPFLFEALSQPLLCTINPRLDRFHRAAQYIRDFRVWHGFIPPPEPARLEDLRATRRRLRAPLVSV